MARSRVYCTGSMSWYSSTLTRGQRARRPAATARFSLSRAAGISTRLSKSTRSRAARCWRRAWLASGSSGTAASSLRASRSEPVSSVAAARRVASSARANWGGTPTAGGGETGGLVGDGELGGQAHRGVVLAEDAQAQAVEGGDGGLVVLARAQHGQAVAHFLGGAAGERDGQEAPGGAAVVEDLVGGAGGEGAGLAGTGPGDDQQRAWGCIGLRVESPEEVTPAIEKANEIDERPVVIDFRTDSMEQVFPMVPAGGSTR